jgi:hypothetical protein
MDNVQKHNNVFALLAEPTSIQLMYFSLLSRERNQNKKSYFKSILWAAKTHSCILYYILSFSSVFPSCTSFPNVLSFIHSFSYFCLSNPDIFSFLIAFSISFSLMFSFYFILYYFFVISLSFVSLLFLVLCFLYCFFLYLVYFHIPAFVLGYVIFNAKCRSLQYYMPEVVLETPFSFPQLHVF